MLAGISQVVTGLAIWKPVQFSGLVSLLGGFQSARLIHFLGMAAIVGFLAVHVALSLLVPRTLVAMVTGGPPRCRSAPMRSPFRLTSAPGRRSGRRSAPSSTGSSCCAEPRHRDRGRPQPLPQGGAAARSGHPFPEPEAAMAKLFGTRLSADIARDASRRSVVSVSRETRRRRRPRPVEAIYRDSRSARSTKVRTSPEVGHRPTDLRSRHHRLGRDLRRGAEQLVRGVALEPLSSAASRSARTPAVGKRITLYQNAIESVSTSSAISSTRRGARHR